MTGQRCEVNKVHDTLKESIINRYTRLSISEILFTYSNGLLQI